MKFWTILAIIYHPTRYTLRDTGETMWDVEFQRGGPTIAAPTDEEALRLAKRMGFVHPILYQEPSPDGLYIANVH